MKTYLIRGMGLVLALSLTSVAVGAQRRPPSGGELEDRCACTAEGADCLFGNSGGCAVTCPGSNCSCSSASCRFGFPFAAHCSCG